MLKNVPHLAVAADRKDHFMLLMMMMRSFFNLLQYY